MYVCMLLLSIRTSELGLFCWAVSVGLRVCEGKVCCVVLCYARVVEWGEKGERGYQSAFFFFSISTFFFFFDELLVRDTEYDLFPRS